MLHLMTVVISVQEQYCGRESKISFWFKIVMITTVQDLIDALNKIEDKSLYVRVDGYPIGAINVEPRINRVFIRPDNGE